MEVYNLSSTSIDRHEDTSKGKRRLNDSHGHASSSLPSIPCSIPLTTTRLSKVSKASLVWQFFDKLDDIKDLDKARIPCKVCQQLVKTNSRTNFNLVAHLETKHRDALSDAMYQYSKGPFCIAEDIGESNFANVEPNYILLIDNTEMMSRLDLAVFRICYHVDTVINNDATLQYIPTKNIHIQSCCAFD
ncbi:hypothetical protein O5D80_001910 [Batrachochytrium dendrobatidis]|nr:hypothetical protein O5D80_001910 [Batrachochytrium dendrobatidis]